MIPGWLVAGVDFGPGRGRTVGVGCGMSSDHCKGEFLELGYQVP